MPTYSYRCTECGNAFDIQQAFTDNSLTECPVCAGKLRKIFSAVGVTFNGSGFYRNDSRAAAQKSGGGTDKGGSDKGGSDKGSSDKGSSDKKSSGSGGSSSGSSDSSKPSSSPVSSGSGSKSGSGTSTGGK